MAIMRCIKCDKIKDSSEFANKQVCKSCYGMPKIRKSREKTYLCYLCKKKVPAVDLDGFCEKCSVSYWGRSRVIHPDQNAQKEKNAAPKPSENNGGLSKRKKTNRFLKIKKEIINLIFELASEGNVDEIPGFEEINLSAISKEQLLQNYTLEELAVLLSTLDHVSNLDF